MSTKLTLRLDEQLIRIAKQEAKKSGKSLSKMVGDYFRFLKKKSTQRSSAIKNDLPPLTKSLAGILKNSKLSEKDYYRHLEDKYL